jgi:hypothetical protein
LAHLNEHRLHTSWQQKVFTKLLGLNYKVIYQKGVDNRAIDALSRKPSYIVHVADCNAIPVVQPKWLEEVIQSYDVDPYPTEVLAKLMIDSSFVPNFSLQNGFLTYKGKVWIGNDSALQLKLITVVHCSAFGGLSGVPVTYRKLKILFAWKGLKKAVESPLMSPRWGGGE